jgi:hypothetical protein
VPRAETGLVGERIEQAGVVAIVHGVATLTEQGREQLHEGIRRD